MKEKILIKTLCCPFCGKCETYTVNKKDYDDYLNGTVVLVCFSYLTAEQRERLISGVCPKCWNRIFKKSNKS